MLFCEPVCKMSIFFSLISLLVSDLKKRIISIASQNYLPLLNNHDMML